MKRVLLIFTAAAIFSSCGNNDAQQESADSTQTVSEEDAPIAIGADGKNYFGEEITEDGAVTMDEFLANLENDDLSGVKLKATIHGCCQAKGCWMNVEMTDSTELMRVTFKDYGFFVPKNAGGKKAVFEGFAYYDTTTVEMLKHYAEDAGDPQEVIDTITTPQVELSFEATGVIIYN